MYNRTAQLIKLVSHLDDDDPVDPGWNDFRKQYYPNEDSYWEYFNLRFNDTEKPLDLYMDLVKMLVDTNQKGITGTKQEFATTLGTAPMRKSIRRQHVKNPKALKQYRRKSKKKDKSTSSSDDTDDSNDSDESLGYRRSPGHGHKRHGKRLRHNKRRKKQERVWLIPTPMRRSIRQYARNLDMLEQYQRKPKKKYRSSSSSSDDTYNDNSDGNSQDDYNKRRMLEVDKTLSTARVPELNFKKILSSMEGGTKYLRSLYVGEGGEKDAWNKDVEWKPKKSISWNNGDSRDQPINDRDKLKEKELKGNGKDTHVIGWEHQNIALDKKNSKKWNEVKKKEWDNFGHKKDKKNEPNDEVWIKNKENSKDDKSSNTDVWGKQGRDKKIGKNENNFKQKINKWNTDDSIKELKKARVSDWETLSTTRKKINDIYKAKHMDDGWPEPKKKDSWDSYGNKKIKEYDENITEKKKENEIARNKNNWQNVGKISWADDESSQKGKADLKSKTKNNKWRNIGRSNKDSWESKPLNKKVVWSDKITKGDYDDHLKKKSNWDDKQIKEDSWEDKLKKKDTWDNTHMKKDTWKNKRITHDNSDSWDDKPVKKDSWNEKPVKIDSWDDKPKKNDNWDDKPVKNEKNYKWGGQKDKSIMRWREDKPTRDWDPPPNRKKKYDDDDYYEKPRNKYAKRDRDMLNVRTPIPFIGKKGIYEDI